MLPHHRPAIAADRSDPDANRVSSPCGIASIHACMGEIATSLDWLERAYDEHDQTLVWVEVHPRLDSIRGEPRFRAIVQKMGR